MNYHYTPHDLIEFQICDLADKEKAYLLPEKKKVRENYKVETILVYLFSKTIKTFLNPSIGYIMC